MDRREDRGARGRDPAFGRAAEFGYAQAMPGTLPKPSPLATAWGIDPDVCYLNHGSFGACPTAVLRAQSELRAHMERELIRFFTQELEGRMDAARAALAGLVGCGANELAFLPNATTGVATVLANRTFEAGDEILVNTHEYPACLNNTDWIAERTGARVVRCELPFPVAGEDEIVERVLAGVTDRTRLCLISHITSPTALVLPIGRIVRELEARGVDTVVDGAHAPGAIDVKLSEIKPAYYTANCHKWVCSPKGSAMLYVREDRRAGFRPLVLSNSANGKAGRDQFLVDFDYIGTSDYTAMLCIPEAIRVMAELVGDEGSEVERWGAIREHNHNLAMAGRDLICERLGIEITAPDEMNGPLSSVILPAHEPDRWERLRERPSRYHDALQDALVERHGIQVPVWPHRFAEGGAEHRILRISAQLYNSLEQYAFLAEAVAEELERERAL